MSRIEELRAEILELEGGVQNAECEYDSAIAALESAENKLLELEQEELENSRTDV